MTETADAAVVGAGILGAFVALALQERGARTILVERDQIARGTTANSFAWVNATAKSEHEARLGQHIRTALLIAREQIQ